MPIPQEIVDQFFEHPLPDSKRVRVSSEIHRGFGLFNGPSIPFDLRSYILYGTTSLPEGTKILTQFEIDTRKPTLLVMTGNWYIDGTWYHGFEPAALEVLGVSPDKARPFSWSPNVPIETLEDPPYQEGQILHARTPATPAATAPPASSTPRARRWFSFRSRPPAAASPRASSGPTLGGGTLTSLDLEVGESKERTWSCKARRVGSAEDGELFLTSRRLLFCPHRSDNARGVSQFVAQRRELTDTGCKRVEDPHSPGGSSTGLRLLLVGNHEEIFLVENPMSVMEKFSKWIHPVG